MNQQDSLARRGIVLVAVCLAAWSTNQLLEADEVRYYEQNGVTYQETRRKVSRPLVQTAMTQQQQTVYRQQVSTEWRDVQRSYYVPVTENRVQQYWQKRLNPFAPPYLAQRVVPVTRYELRGDTVKVPYTRTDCIPQVVTVQVPVSSQQMVEDEVITRVAVGVAQPPATFVAAQPAAGAASPAIASRPATNPSVISSNGTVSPSQPVKSTVPSAAQQYNAPRNDLPASTPRNFAGSAPSSPSAPATGGNAPAGNPIGGSPVGNMARPGGGNPAPIGAGNALPSTTR